MNNEYYMEYAIVLANMCKGQTSPNPAVGAVLVKNNQIIGIGSHLFAGTSHAEVVAIDMAKEHAAGATLYVTLEPCSHYGKTPPCVDAIIKAKINKVVIATLDHNPQVRGNGVRHLLNAGINVEVGVLEHKAFELCRDFFYSITHKRPYITLKCGMSIDAKLATHKLDSKWITSDISRIDAHYYRHTHDAILTGINSIVNDNSLLNTRLINGGRNPIRIILDTNLRIDFKAQVITDHNSPTWIVCGNDANPDKINKLRHLSHITIIQLKDKSIDLILLMDILYKRGITSILVEGGSKIHTSFLETKLINQLIIYISPQLIGGANAPQFFAGTGFSRLSDSIKLKLHSTTKLGDDLKLIYLYEDQA